MKRICIYWLCIACFICPQTQAAALKLSDITEAAYNAANDESDLERQIRELKAEITRLKAKPDPGVSVPTISYRWETRYKQQFVNVPVYCSAGKFCGWRSVLKTVPYRVRIAVASSQHKVDPAAAPTPMDQVKAMVDLVQLPKHSVVLDPGCGSDARIAIELARRGYSVLAFEIDKERYQQAKEAIDKSGYSFRIGLVNGDCTQYIYGADAVVAYLYPGTLETLARKLNTGRLQRFISYMHPVKGLDMKRTGDIYVWSKPVPKAVIQRRYAIWGGRYYTGRLCNNPRCAMCNSIQRQLGY